MPQWGRLLLRQGRSVCCLSLGETKSGLLVLPIQVVRLINQRLARFNQGLTPPSRLPGRDTRHGLPQTVLSQLFLKLAHHHPFLGDRPSSSWASMISSSMKPLVLEAASSLLGASSSSSLSSLTSPLQCLLEGGHSHVVKLESSIMFYCNKRITSINRIWI